MRQTCDRTPRVGVVLGTRPEAIKLAPVIAALRVSARFEPVVISTGQHRHLLDRSLGLLDRAPDVDLDLMVPGQSLTDLAGRAVVSIGAALVDHGIDLLVVQGDTTTTLSGRGALTEDLDLGLRLVVGGWRTRFCHLTYVDQQGLASWRPLLRQRTRWIQGHYQCWRHLGPLAASRRVPLVARLDLMLYLVLVVTVLVVSYTVAVGVLGAAGLVTVTNDFLVWVPYGEPRRLVSLAMSVLPVCVFLGTYQRHSAHPFRWYQLPAAALAFTCYGYVWLWVSVRALANLALRRNAWVKTPRLARVVP